MAYAGQEAGSAGAYSGGQVPHNAVSPSGTSTEHAAAVIVLGALAGLIVIRMGFRGISVGKVTGGLVKG